MQGLGKIVLIVIFVMLFSSFACAENNTIDIQEFMDLIQEQASNKPLDLGDTFNATDKEDPNVFFQKFIAKKHAPDITSAQDQLCSGDAAWAETKVFVHNRACVQGQGPARIYIFVDVFSEPSREIFHQIQEDSDFLLTCQVAWVPISTTRMQPYSGLLLEKDLSVMSHISFTPESHKRITREQKQIVDENNQWLQKLAQYFLEQEQKVAEDDQQSQHLSLFMPVPAYLFLNEDRQTNFSIQADMPELKLWVQYQQECGVE